MDDQEQICSEKNAGQGGQCPGCGSKKAEVFYRADNIPVHSCLLFENEQEAVKYPRRNLALGFCQDCGLIYNTEFEPSVLEYNGGYEDMQTCSGHFRRYLESLAQRVIERYELYDKDIIEIGCGKGDFLLLLCEMGNNRGVGLDPSFDPKRVSEKSKTKITFIRDFYSEKYSHLKADFICCRHTLEHIYRPGEFVRMIRKAVGERKDTIVFFDVPNVLRVLDEGAFWDVYYEHRSYFSMGTLAGLFERRGFEPVQLELDYDDQYVLIAGRASEGCCAEQSRADRKEDMNSLKVGVKAFADSAPKRIEGWQKALKELVKKGQKATIWGSGSKCVAFLEAVGVADATGSIVDINPYRQGKYIPGTGRLILPPSVLVDEKPSLVVVMNPVYEAEIREQIEMMGIRPELATVLTY